jgi:hypothetical protein
LEFERKLAAVDFGCQEFEDIFDEVSMVPNQNDEISADGVIGGSLHGSTWSQDNEPGRCGKEVFR